jgi:hypothetical protein
MSWKAWVRLAAAETVSSAAHEETLSNRDKATVIRFKCFMGWT